MTMREKAFRSQPSRLSSGPRLCFRPPSPASPRRTRLAGLSAGVHDVDSGVTSIRSPAIALPASGANTLSFRYYLAHGSNSSSADFFRVRVVGATTTTVLERLGAAVNRNEAWSTASVSLAAFARIGGRLRERFFSGALSRFPGFSLYSSRMDGRA